MATEDQTKRIEGVTEAFATDDPTQQAAVAEVRKAFGATEEPVAPLPNQSNAGKPGFDVFGNPLKLDENTFASPNEALESTRFSRLAPGTASADTLADGAKVETAEEIQARKTKEAQAEIDAINRLYADKLAEQRTVNLGQERQTSAVSTLTGLAGSTEANVQATKTEKLGTKELDTIRNEQAVMIQSVLSDIRTSAVEEAKSLREEARLDSETALANRTAKATEAVNNVAVLATTGVTAEGLKATDPESYQHLVNTLGGEDMVKGYFTLNRPKETVIDKKIEGGKYIIAYRNPLTGETRVETVDLGLPEGYSKTIDAGDRILAIPDNWDGDPANLITINKGLEPGKGGSGTGFDETTDDTVDAIMSGIGGIKDVSIADGKRAAVIDVLSQKFNEAKASGDMEGIMRSSAAFDKVPSDTFLQSFEKVSNVLGQLGVLQESLSQGFGEDKEGNPVAIKTSPIFGALKGANPWSTNGQVIKAQLNAIVPNLARGVYGEVGVLTDNDIKTYSKTIPNLSSTDDIRNAVLYITVDMIRRSMEGKIKTQAAGQRDMSGFADVYSDMTTQANTVLSSIGNEAEQDDFADFRSQLQEGEVLIQRGNEMFAVPESEVEDNDIRI